MTWGHCQRHVTTQWGGGLTFESVQAAVDFVGENPSSKPVTICIGAGTFVEPVHIRKGQDGITLRGQGLDTVLSANKTRKNAGSSLKTATLIVEGDAFSASDLRVENTVVSTTEPSAAVAVFSQQTTWERVAIVSWDDTLAIASGWGHLFKSCFVSGLTDIVWGSGEQLSSTPSFSSGISPTPKFNSQGTLPLWGRTNHPMACQLARSSGTAASMAMGGPTLGRPYRAQSIAVFVDCQMGPSVAPEGWNDYSEYLSLKQFIFQEYGSYGPGANSTARQFGQVEGKTRPPDMYTVNGFIGRSV